MNEKIKMNKNIKILSLTLLPENDRLEGPEPDEELIKSIKEFGVIYPIIITEKKGGFEVIDGRRRIKAVRILEHKTIKTINYSGLSPEDEATWALILNDQRSDNVITEFKYYSKLAESKDWNELRKEYGFNKNHVQKIMSLGKIKELDILTKAYEQGNVAETTLFEVAKLGEERQEYVMDILENKGKLALSDVREAKKIKQKEAMASLPDLTPQKSEISTQVEVFSFAVGKPESNEAKLFSDIQEAYAERDKVSGSRLFKIFEV
ncbi:MAG: ParB/RepB/Spo0J family partition protein [Kosmotogaceae bacterium]